MLKNTSILVFLPNVLKNSIYVTKYDLNLQVFYAPHPGRFPGEHSSNAVGHTNGLPKVARLTTVTTVLENLRKFSNYTLQVSILSLTNRIGHDYVFKRLMNLVFVF